MSSGTNYLVKGKNGQTFSEEDSIKQYQKIVSKEEKSEIEIRLCKIFEDLKNGYI